MVAAGLCGQGNLFSFDYLGLVAREPVKDRLRSHRALWQLGKVATLEMLGHAVVKRPERPAFELLMARVAELLNGVIDFALRQSLGINQVDKEIGSAIARDLGRFVVGIPSRGN